MRSFSSFGKAVTINTGVSRPCSTERWQICMWWHCSYFRRCVLLCWSCTTARSHPPLRCIKMLIWTVFTAQMNRISPLQYHEFLLHLTFDIFILARRTVLHLQGLALLVSFLGTQTLIGSRNTEKWNDTRQMQRKQGRKLELKANL